MMKRKRWIGLVMWAGLLLVAAEGTVWAECGTCQFCKKDTRAFVFAYELCMVANEQSGSMCCREDDISFNKFCTLTGDACYGIIVDGGGGSGGGGGSACNYQNGWCPAECMSCSGTGRPAI